MNQQVVKIESDEIKLVLIKLNEQLLRIEIDSMNAAGHYDEDAYMRVASHYKAVVDRILLGEYVVESHE